MSYRFMSHNRVKISSMFKSLIGKLILIGAISAMLVTISLPSIASADAITSDVCSGADIGNSATNCDPSAGSSLNGILRNVLNAFTIVIGIIAVFAVIIQGFRFITSGGDPNTVTSARNGLLYAVVGLVLCAIAQILVHFVIAKTTGK